MMKYPKEYLDEIKLRLKVSQIVSKSVKLRKRGKDNFSLSIFFFVSFFVPVVFAFLLTSFEI